MTELVDKLAVTGNLPREAFGELLRFRNMETTEYLFEQARITRQKVKRTSSRYGGGYPSAITARIIVKCAECAGITSF